MNESVSAAWRYLRDVTILFGSSTLAATVHILAVAHLEWYLKGEKIAWSAVFLVAVLFVAPYRYYRRLATLPAPRWSL